MGSGLAAVLLIVGGLLLVVTLQGRLAASLAALTATDRGVVPVG
jgi:uncharacterized ion transporter superfamily protein YfcC